MGNSHPNIVPYEDFPTADGNMILAVGNDSQFSNLCKLVGHPEWAADERFSTNAQRVKYRKVLIPLIRQITVFKSTGTWVMLLEGAGVPCGPINTIKEVFDDPQIKARGVRIDLPHPLAGTVPLVANPIRLSETPVTYRSAPPLLGEHTREVLQAVLGFSAEYLDELALNGVI